MKAKLIGLSPIAGVVLPEVTVRVTGTDFEVAPVPLTVTVPVNVPAASPERLTLALIVPALVPLGGLSVNQFAFSLALQFRVPPPVLETVIGWADGFVPPTVPLKERLPGFKLIAGVAVEAVRVRVTGTVLAATPVPLTVTVPVNVPAASPERLTLALIVPALVPAFGLSVNQPACSLALQVSVPPPVLAMLMV